MEFTCPARDSGAFFYEKQNYLLTMCQAQYLYIYLAVFFVRLQDKPSHHRYITVTRGCKLMILKDKSKP